MSRNVGPYSGARVGVGQLAGLDAADRGAPTMSAGSFAPMFVIQLPITATATTEDFITAANNITFSVVGGVAYVQTVQAGGKWDVRTASGDAGGSLIARFDTAAAGGFDPDDAAGSVSRGPVRLVGGTDALSVDKTGGGAAVGRILLFCVRS